MFSHLFIYHSDLGMRPRCCEEEKRSLSSDTLWICLARQPHMVTSQGGTGREGVWAGSPPWVPEEMQTGLLFTQEHSWGGNSIRVVVVDTQPLKLTDVFAWDFRFFLSPLHCSLSDFFPPQVPLNPSSSSFLSMALFLIRFPSSLFSSLFIIP